MRIFALALLMSCPLTYAARPCIAPSELAAHLNKDVCVSAHVYEVVELDDGTRFLDVCSPDTQDDKCMFSIMSPKADRREVGELAPLLYQDIQIRGVVRPFPGGRSQILLSHSRQLHGGAEKFRPNPALLSGFSAESGKPAFNSPGLKGSHHRSVFKSH